MQHTVTPEFSRPVRIDALPNSGLVQHIQAHDEEKARLAERFGIPAIHTLEAHITLRPGRNKGSIEVSGQLTGQITQSCVVTSVPLQANVKESFSLLFLPESSDTPEDPEDLDQPEFFQGNQIDIGELTAQYFYLALNPYPRSNDECLHEQVPSG